MFTGITLSALLALIALGAAAFQVASLFADAAAGCAGFEMRDFKRKLRNDAATDAQWGFFALESDGGDGGGD
jgi:hypothetical protein